MLEHLGYYVLLQGHSKKAGKNIFFTNERYVTYCKKIK
jgi:hypothetical protein